MPEQVVVKLFAWSKPVATLQIIGPAQLVSPLNMPVQSLSITAKGGSACLAANGRKATSNRILLRSSSSRGVTLQLPDGVPPRAYDGTIEVSASGGTLVVKNYVPLKSYVMSVAGSETPAGWPAEALKAQAVLTQTRLLRYRPGDALNDSTEKESYRGLEAVRPEVRTAVDAVWRKFASFHGRAVDVYYHSSCAGGTSNGVNYFGLKPADREYLRGVACSYCRSSPFWAEKDTRIPKKLFLGKFGGVPKVVQTDERKRPVLVRLNGKRMVSGYEMWMQIGRIFGWDKVPGTRYRFEETADLVSVVSTGAGHGIGLCQWGAAGLSRHGADYKRILQYYLPGVEVSSW